MFIVSVTSSLQTNELPTLLGKPIVPFIYSHFRTKGLQPKDDFKLFQIRTNQSITCDGILTNHIQGI